jgi:hypothetical protein
LALEHKRPKERIMNCPRCNTNCRTEIYEGVEIDRCESCSGVWLDYEEIITILKEREVKFSEEEIEAMKSRIGQGMPDAEGQHQVLCPKCDENMRTVNYQANTGVIIDRCPKNCGLWFDQGELEAIQANAEYWEDQSKEQMQKWKTVYKEHIESASQEYYPDTGNPIKKAINLFHRYIGDE